MKQASTKAAGFLGAFGASVAFAAVMFVIGGFLTVTVIGAIIGIPLMIASILVPFIGPFVGLGLRREQCPVCKSKIPFMTWAKGVTCKACKTRLLVRDKQLRKI